MNTIDTLNHLIRNRRSIFPAQYIDKEIDDIDINTILENANWAPNHKKTEPWRFIVYKGAGLQRLSESLGKAYKQKFIGESFSDLKYKKTVKKPLQCGSVIAICMQREPKESLPEWEEIAAVACAVQNMWLSCTAMGIGSYWSSPGIAVGQNDFMDLRDGERCLGLFYMGYWDVTEIPAGRGETKQKVRWVRD